MPTTRQPTNSYTPSQPYQSATHNLSLGKGSTQWEAPFRWILQHSSSSSGQTHLWEPPPALRLNLRLRGKIPPTPFSFRFRVHLTDSIATLPARSFQRPTMNFGRAALIRSNGQNGAVALCQRQRQPPIASIWFSSPWTARIARRPFWEAPIYLRHRVHGIARG